MQRKLIIEEFGLPELLMVAAQKLMFIPSAALAQNPLLLAGFIGLLLSLSPSFHLQLAQLL